MINDESICRHRYHHEHIKSSIGISIHKNPYFEKSV